MLPRPRIRLPLWSACAIVLAAYAIRSVARGFDFRPDMPTDAIALVLFALVLAGVALLRRQPPPEEPGEDPSPDNTEEPGR